MTYYFEIMRYESSKKLKQKEEEERLAAYYQNIISQKYSISTEAQKEFMMQLINTKISKIGPRTYRAKIIHYTLRIGILVLSAVSTIILGLKYDGQSWNLVSSNLALALTATVTFLSALASFWDIENYWIRLKVMENKLKQLRYEFVFSVMGEKDLPNTKLKDFLDRFIAIQADEYWENYFTSMERQATRP
jgi:hypothetical protein